MPEKKTPKPVLEGHYDQAHTPATPRWKRKAKSLSKKNENLKNAIRGAVDHPDLNGPDILEEAADMLEERTITLASQLRKTAKMQRDALQKGESDE